VYVLRGAFTRTRTKSREPTNIMSEIRICGTKVLGNYALGQNVDSYCGMAAD
jgi:hypothetical protein